MWSLKKYPNSLETMFEYDKLQDQSFSEYVKKVGLQKNVYLPV